MTPRRCMAFVGASLIAGCTNLASAPSHQFLERSYIAPRTTTDSTLMYEAQIAPHIFLVDHQASAFEALALDTSVHVARGVRLLLTPMFRIRQLRDSSAAVRTPSFMPRLSLEYFLAHRFRGTAMGARPVFDWAILSGARLTVAHHSNGQAGCFREGQRPANSHSEADECTGPTPDTGVVRLNRADGDFSSTFVQIMLHETLIKRGDGERPPFVLGASVSYDRQASGFLPGTLPRIERELYGNWRARTQLEGMVADGIGCSDLYGWCGLRGRSRVSGMYEWAPRHLGPLADRLAVPITHYRWYVELSHTFDGLNNVGPFVRAIDGQDYYNIGFVNRRKAWLIGIMIDLAGYESVRSR